VALRYSSLQLRCRLSPKTKNNFEVLEKRSVRRNAQPALAQHAKTIEGGNGVQIQMSWLITLCDAVGFENILYLCKFTC
jgi:hypothetical protein